MRTQRTGFTILEMMVSMTLLLVIFGAATTFFRTQTRAIDSQAGRWDAQQNAQYAVNAIDRDLRVAGVGVVVKQPMLVQASATAITFNADLVTRLKTDPGAIYFNPEADQATVMALGPGNAVTLPNSAVRYPDSSYTQAGGLPGTAETISYWIELDTATPRPDDYVMYRRANDATPRVVAASLLLPAGEPAFRFYRSDSIGRTVEIPAAGLPLLHSAAIHGSGADTGRSRRTDSIRVVRVRLTGVFQAADGTEAKRTVETGIRIMNSGLISRTTCGDIPAFSSVLAATLQVVNNSPRVRLTWTPALDETAGERDVERYALYRRATTAFEFGEPFASIAAGLVTYSFTDTDVNPGDAWVYGVAAQDCTPASSSVSSSGAVIIP